MKTKFPAERKEMKGSGEINRVQEINRKILNEIDRVCKKYDICYYLDCGALLGAVRHQSFIPWDDDVDISFTRREYERFAEVVGKEWRSGPFLLHKPGDFSSDRFLDFIVRVVDTGETVTTNIYNKVGKGAAEAVWNHPGIDVFLLDEIPDHPKYQRKLCRRLTVDYGLALGHRCYIDYAEYKGLQKPCIWLLAHIGKLFSVKKIIERYEANCTRYRGCEGNYYFYSNFSLKDIKKRNRREWYQQGTQVLIDENAYNAPLNYHEVLKMNYGDYMKLPPERERVLKHLKNQQGE